MFLTSSKHTNPYSSLQTLESSFVVCFPAALLSLKLGPLHERNGGSYQAINPLEAVL